MRLSARCAVRACSLLFSYRLFFLGSIALGQQTLPCPLPDAELQVIFQSASVFQTQDILAGVIEPQDPARPTRLVVSETTLDLYAAIVSQLSGRDDGIQGWDVTLRVLGDVEVLEADTLGTAAARTSDVPPGLVDAEHGYLRTEYFVPLEEGIPVVESAVVLSMTEDVTLQPRGTATVLHMKLQGPFGAAAKLRWVPSPDRGSGGGAHGYSNPSVATLGGESVPFDCLQDADLVFMGGPPDFERCCDFPDPSGPRAPVLARERVLGKEVLSSLVDSLAERPEGFVIAGYDDSQGHSDAKLVKLDLAGEVLWQKPCGIEQPTIPRCLQGLADGYVIAGYAEFHDSGSAQVYLARTDLEGNVLWSRTYGGPEADGASCVAATADGGFVVTGHTWSFTDKGFPDLYLLRTDGQGEVVWERAIGREEKNVQGKAVIQTSDGGFAVTGPGGGDDEGVYILKTDAGGERLWDRLFPLGSLAEGTAITEGPSGTLVVAGRVQTYQGAPAIDTVYLSKLSSDGELLWQKLYARPKSRADSIRHVAGGGYVIGGTTDSLGPTHAYVLKVDEDGKPLHESFFGFETHVITGVSGIAPTEDGGYAFASTYRAAMGQPPTLSFVELSPPTGQLPGDCNLDGKVDVSDGICLLGFLFLHKPERLACGDGTLAEPSNRTLHDFNGDGRVDISDGVAIFGYLFLGTSGHALGFDCVAIPGCAGVCVPGTEPTSRPPRRP